MTTIISQLYTSRRILLDQLKNRGYAIEDYNHFSFNEVRVMYTNKQLDMLITNPTTEKKIYIKYHIITKLGASHVYDYIDDLFHLEEILSKDDDLLIITKYKVPDTMIALMSNTYKRDNIFFSIFNLKQLSFNILNHALVPPHRILNKEEETTIRKKYNIVKDSELPEISRFDPVAMAIGMRPKQVCEIIRPSKTSIITKYYRLCY
jgi:DNA-directed RNA polymerase I, II, and III subunit RPABC1